MVQKLTTEASRNSLSDSIAVFYVFVEIRYIVLCVYIVLF